MTKYSPQLKRISSLSDIEIIRELGRRANTAQIEIDRIVGFSSLRTTSLKYLLPSNREEAEAVVFNIFNRYHTSACVLKNRKHNPYVIIEEKDAQDLFEALLREHFDEVTPEESVPTTAGGTTFIDFLLPRYQIAIEVKMGSAGNRELRKQINDDKGCYPNHPNCKLLLVLIYDPDSKVMDPRRLEMQLSDVTDKMITKVYVRPH